MSRPCAWDWLGERTRPHYGQVVLWILLASAFALAGYFLTHPAHLPGCRQPAPSVSVFSFFPDALLLDERVFLGCGVVFFASGLLWLGQLFIPWSSGLAAVSFTATVALYLERAQQQTHVAHVTYMLLILYALWYQVYHREIRTALAEGRFWISPLYPRWVYSASVFYVGLFYGWAGMSKLATSGLNWPNGVSMQLWTTLWGDPQSCWTQLILSHRVVAIVFQVGTLIVESSGLLAILLPRLRPWIGLGLVSLHYGIVSVFGWAFHFNGVLVALVLLPFYTWIPQLVERLEKERATAEPLVAAPQTTWARIRKGLRARLNVLGRFR